MQCSSFVFYFNYLSSFFSPFLALASPFTTVSAFLQLKSGWNWLTPVTLVSYQTYIHTLLGLPSYYPYLLDYQPIHTSVTPPKTRRKMPTTPDNQSAAPAGGQPRKPPSLKSTVRMVTWAMNGKKKAIKAQEKETMEAERVSEIAEFLETAKEGPKQGWFVDLFTGLWGCGVGGWEIGWIDGIGVPYLCGWMDDARHVYHRCSGEKNWVFWLNSGWGKVRVRGGEVWPKGGFFVLFFLSTLFICIFIFFNIFFKN